MRNSADKLGLTKLASHFEIQIDRTEFTAALNCIKAVSKGKVIYLHKLQDLTNHK